MTKNEEKIECLINSKMCEVAIFSSGVEGKVKNTNIYFTAIKDGRFEWWDNITGKTYKSFEDVLDSLDPVMQTELLFHLDLFSDIS